MSKQYSRRSFLSRTALTSSAGILMSSSLGALMPQIIFALGNVPKQLRPGQSVYELQGEVWVDNVRATMDTLIKPTSSIRTASNSYIIFVVGKDSHILRENSELNLGDTGLVESGMRLLTGKVLSVFGSRAEQESTYSIKTTTATIGIRGTAVYSESWSDRSYVCTCYGQTNISATQDPAQQELVATRHHDAPRFILAEPENGKLIIPAPVFNHTDEELMLLEALVGREVPFSAVQSYGGTRRSY